MVTDLFPIAVCKTSHAYGISRYGTGFCVAYSGPVGALICFLIVGVDVFFVMQCLGEMSTLFPIQGKQLTQRNLNTR